MLLLILGFVLIYLVMVAQFRVLLSPFIVILTVPPCLLTGGLFGLVAAGEQLSMLSLLGFAVLMGTVVNNGMFVDCVNQLRRGGLSARCPGGPGRTACAPS